MLCWENPTRLQTPLPCLQATVSRLHRGVGASVRTHRTRRHRANFKVYKFQEWFPLLGGGAGRDGSQTSLNISPVVEKTKPPKDAHMLIPRIHEYLTLRPKVLCRCDELRTWRWEIVLDSWGGRGACPHKVLASGRQAGWSVSCREDRSRGRSDSGRGHEPRLREAPGRRRSCLESPGRASPAGPEVWSPKTSGLQTVLF